MNHKVIQNLIVAELAKASNLPVALPNASYKPSLLSPYLRVTLLPTEPAQIAQGQDRILRTVTLVQVDLFTPSNTGESAVVDTIIDYFNNFTNRFIIDDNATLHIDRSWRGVSFTSDDWYRTPIIVRTITFKG